MALTLEQMAMYAKAAGLPNPAKWAAIGMAESSGRAGTVNEIGCVGIWQINQPVWVKDQPSWTVSWLKDPANNARAAKVVYGKQGFGAWQAYTDGSWRQYYKPSMVQQAGWLDDFWDGMKDGWDFGPGPEDLNDDDGFSDDNLEGNYGAISDLGDFYDLVTNPHNWVRLAYIVGGAVLVGIGLNVVIRQTPPAKKARDTAMSFVGSKVKAASAQRKTTKASKPKSKETSGE